MIDSAIILAAGLGKRMRNYNPDIPKPLIKVNSKPFIQYAIDLLNEVRAKEIIINVHYKSCLLYTSPSPRDGLLSRMPSSA